MKKILLTLIIFSFMLWLFKINFKADAQTIEKRETTEQIINSPYYSIRDDVLLLNKFQSQIGICWAFASTRTLESAFAKKYNEYFSFSDGSIGIQTKDVNAGYVQMFNNFMKERGIAFESDFPYQYMQYVNTLNDKSSRDFLLII